MTSSADINRVFHTTLTINVGYKTRVAQCVSRIVPSGQLQALADVYRKFFGVGGERVKFDRSAVPPVLLPLFTFMAPHHATGNYFFNNGAGKVFMLHLLNVLVANTNETWAVRISTTTNSKTDWCGLRPSPGGLQICGVADFLLVTSEALPLVVGEVKPCGGEFQLLAGVLAQNEYEGYCPLGVLLNKGHLSLFSTNHTRRGKKKVTTAMEYIFSVTEFDEVLLFLDTVLEKALATQRWVGAARLEVLMSGATLDEDPPTPPRSQYVESFLNKIQDLTDKVDMAIGKLSEVDKAIGKLSEADKRLEQRLFAIETQCLTMRD